MNTTKTLIYRAAHFPLIGALSKRVLNLTTPAYKKLIFVASTGRSGTNTLYDIFNQIENVVAFHEAAPVMFRKVLAEKNDGDSRRAWFIYHRVKSVMIRLDNFGRNRDFYFESNHLFLKSFSDYVIEEFGDKVEVVHLVRDPVLVASSMYKLNTIPGKTELGKKWYLDYRSSQNLLQMQHILDSQLNHDFYKCLWYFYEMESRVSEFRKKYPSVKLHTLRTEDLNNPNRIEGLLTDLEIDVTKLDLGKIVGKKHNKQSSRKTSTLEADQAELMHQQFLDCLNQLPPRNSATADETAKQIPDRLTRAKTILILQ